MLLQNLPQLMLPFEVAAAWHVVIIYVAAVEELLPAAFAAVAVAAVFAAAVAAAALVCADSWTTFLRCAVCYISYRCCCCCYYFIYEANNISTNCLANNFTFFSFYDFHRHLWQPYKWWWICTECVNQTKQETAIECKSDEDTFS